MQFTGERWIPGQVEQRIEDDHVQRYLFAAQHSPGKRVLDIACGSGAGSYMLAGTGRASRVVGVDIAPEAVAYARETYRLGNLAFEEGSIEGYSTDQSWDLIVCLETIEHVADEGPVLENLRRCLRPGGVLLISSPNRPVTSPSASIDDAPQNTFHVREFTPEELKVRLLRAGFSGLKVYGQRLRCHSRSGLVMRVLESARRLGGVNPDRASSPKVRPYRFLTPRYFVIRAEA
jgi:2-polyprenyl-3-methyl-5-hydroxy-6-metoxy-1,4-benzoquinol methylase